MSPLAIINGRVLTMDGPALDPGTVLIEGERIAAVAPDLPIPPGTEVVDAAGRVVMPGLIDAHCHLGVHEEIFRDEGNDTNESTDPLTPHLRALDAVNPNDLGFTDALSGGVTAVCVAPGSANIIGGEMAVLQTAGRVVDEMVLRQPAGLKAALGENPKRVYGAEKKMPRTRMASAALLRTAFVQAREYLRKQERAAAGRGDPPEHDLKHEAVARVLRGEVPLRLHAHRADDIATALRIRREFGFRLVIEHATEGWRIADLLAREGVPVVLGPIITQRAKPEMAGLSLETARIMAEAGVPFAIMTDHPVIPVQYLGLAAMLTVRGGLDEETALRAVTINAARILGLDALLGSITPGKQADLVILSGDPFDVRTRVEKVFIRGRVAWEPR